MWTRNDSAAHAKQPYQSPSAFSPAFEPSTDAIAAQRAPVSDEDSVWSVHKDESPGNAAFGSVDYVTGPVLTGPAAAEEVEQDTMQIDSMSEPLQDVSRMSSQHESGDKITEAGQQVFSSPEVHQDDQGMDSHPGAAVYGQPALAIQQQSQDGNTEAGRQVSSGVRMLQESVDRASYPAEASKSRSAETRQRFSSYTHIAEQVHGDISPHDGEDRAASSMRAHLKHGDISPHGGEDSAASDMRVHPKQASDAAQTLSVRQIGAPLDGSQALSSTPLYSCQLQGLGEVLPSWPGQDLANSTGEDASLTLRISHFAFHVLCCPL